MSGSTTACRVSTVAGVAAADQALNGPMGVAAGPGGIIYASDTNNQRVVVKVQREGIATTIDNDLRLLELIAEESVWPILDISVHVHLQFGQA